MLVNAATGSSKNMTPNWLVAASKGAPGNASTCASPETKRTLVSDASVARRGRKLNEAFGEIESGDRTGGADGARRIERGEAAAAADIEHALAGAKGEGGDEQWRYLSGDALALRPGTDLCLGIPLTALSFVRGHGRTSSVRSCHNPCIASAAAFQERGNERQGIAGA